MPNVNSTPASRPKIFDSLKFFVVQQVPDRKKLLQQIADHGGTIKPLEKHADIVLAKSGHSSSANHVYTKYEYVLDCIEQDQLLDRADYKADAATGITRRPGGPVTGLKNTRTKFTAEEDQALRDFVNQAIRNGEYVGGNKIYIEWAKTHPSHPWQSWRDRWVKTLSRQAYRNPDDDAEETNTDRARNLTEMRDGNTERRSVDQNEQPRHEKTGQESSRNSSRAPSAGPSRTNKHDSTHPKQNQPRETDSRSIEEDARDRQTLTRSTSRQPGQATDDVPSTPKATDRQSLKLTDNVKEVLNLYGFSNHEAELLYQATPDIESIPKDQIEDNWNDMAANWIAHSKQAWKDFYSNVIRPRYMVQNKLRNDQEMSDHVRKIVSDESALNPSMNASPIVPAPDPVREEVTPPRAARETSIELPKPEDDTINSTALDDDHAEVEIQPAVESEAVPEDGPATSAISNSRPLLPQDVTIDSTVSISKGPELDSEPSNIAVPIEEYLRLEVETERPAKQLEVTPVPEFVSARPIETIDPSENLTPAEKQIADERERARKEEEIVSDSSDEDDIVHDLSTSAAHLFAARPSAIRATSEPNPRGELFEFMTQVEHVFGSSVQTTQSTTSRSIQERGSERLGTQIKRSDSGSPSRERSRIMQSLPPFSSQPDGEKKKKLFGRTLPSSQSVPLFTVDDNDQVDPESIPAQRDTNWQPTPQSETVEVTLRVPSQRHEVDATHPPTQPILLTTASSHPLSTGPATVPSASQPKIARVTLGVSNQRHEIEEHDRTSQPALPLTGSSHRTATASSSLPSAYRAPTLFQPPRTSPTPSPHSSGETKSSEHTRSDETHATQASPSSAQALIDGTILHGKVGASTEDDASSHPQLGPTNVDSTRVPRAASQHHSHENDDMTDEDEDGDNNTGTDVDDPDEMMLNLLDDDDPNSDLESITSTDSTHSTMPQYGHEDEDDATKWDDFAIPPTVLVPVSAHSQGLHESGRMETSLDEFETAPEHIPPVASLTYHSQPQEQQKSTQQHDTEQSQTKLQPPQSFATPQQVKRNKPLAKRPRRSTDWSPAIWQEEISPDLSLLMPVDPPGGWPQDIAENPDEAVNVPVSSIEKDEVEAQRSASPQSDRTEPDVEEIDSRPLPQRLTVQIQVKQETRIIEPTVIEDGETESEDESPPPRPRPRAIPRTFHTSTIPRKRRHSSSTTKQSVSAGSNESAANNESLVPKHESADDDKDDNREDVLARLDILKRNSIQRYPALAPRIRRMIYLVAFQAATGDLELATLAMQKMVERFKYAEDVTRMKHNQAKMAARRRGTTYPDFVPDTNLHKNDAMRLIPPGIPGLWTLAHDNALISGDEAKLTTLKRHHGPQIARKRAMWYRNAWVDYDRH